MSRYFFVLITVLLLLTGAYSGNAQTTADVRDVSVMPGDSWVFLRGTLEPVVQNERYILKDSTGEILVWIPGNQWQGLMLKPGDTVVIAGEVKHKSNGTEIETKYVESGGAEGPVYTDIIQLKNNTSPGWVRICGRIVRYLSGDTYVFADESGEMRVAIKDHIWRGLLVNPGSLVEIGGEARRRGGRTELTAEYILKVTHE
ncbi:NirD/YgiW/YdeI family stress tolerance protein [Breznakiella homolactica]|uniref:NirD/YgiW/YdeI family stress tolerance protein n=1 Tax=Breznakiella homolactica TaxID=2798577 RepID=A0A7T7XR52_9SPIR|nr:NirD/YgiW/YdeI family stress tolerance protein [Breznakiella homolactica]QQO10961.1 NirD/YgiW/YdeI family stress tolerance protein [Breznakiella homolactica]